MDPGASAELTIGNNMMAVAEQNALALTQKKRGIQQTFDKERRDASGKQTDSEIEEGGTDVLSGGSAIGTVSKISGSIETAGKTAEGLRESARAFASVSDVGTLRSRLGVSALATPGASAEEIIQKGTSGAVGTFFSGGHQMSEAGAEVNKIGDLITQAKTGVLTEGADKGAGVGVPAIISGIAKKVNVGEARADAIGDLVGHGVGLGMAGVSGIEDIAGGWSKMDTGQKWGNVLGIAGGIVDTAGSFAPVLAPVGLALDVGSAIANWIGDSNESAYKNKTTITPAQAKADKDATADAGDLTAESVTSSGQVAMGPTATITTKVQ